MNSLTQALISMQFVSDFVYTFWLRKIQDWMKSVDIEYNPEELVIKEIVFYTRNLPFFLIDSTKEIFEETGNLKLNLDRFLFTNIGDGTLAHLNTVTKVMRCTMAFQEIEITNDPIGNTSLVVTVCKSLNKKFCVIGIKYMNYVRWFELAEIEEFKNKLRGLLAIVF